MEKKNIKLVTITIKESRLIEEQGNVLLFKPRTRGKKSPIMFPKKCMYNFQKVITWFDTPRGRVKEKCFKFSIPMWLYSNRKFLLETINMDVIITNTHEKDQDSYGRNDF